MARISIAMLSEQAQTQVEQTPAQAGQSEIEVVGQQVEDDMLELQEQQAVEDRKDQAIEDAVQATGELEEEAQAAQQILEQSGEVTQAALESIQRNVKRILKTVGMEQAAVAMESVGSTPKQALTLSMENIEEVVQKIWEAIKKAWATAVDFVKGFLKKLFDGATKLKIRAEKIKEAAGKLKGKSLGLTQEIEKSFKVPESVQNYICHDKKPIKPQEVVSKLKTFNGEINGLVSDIIGVSALENYEKNIEEFNKKYLQVVVDKEIIFDTKLKTAEDFIFAPVFKHVSIKTGYGYRTEFYLSDYCVTIKDSINVGLEKAYNNSAYTGLTKYEPLESDEIVKVCDVVIAQMKDYENIKKDADSFNTFINNFKKTQFDLANKKEEYNQVQKKFYGLILSMTTKGMLNLIKSISTKVRFLNFNVNKAAIDWCASSLTLYKASI